MSSQRRTYAQNRIRELRKARGLTMEQLGGLLRSDITLATVQKLETGQIALSLDYILDFAQALDVSPAEIIDASPFGGVRTLPLIGAIPAGGWGEEIALSDEVVPVPADVGGKRCFALRPNGTSMNLLVDDDGFVVIDPDQIELIDGKHYAVRNGHAEATFKTFRAVPPRLEPCSDDPVHQPIKIGAEPFVVLGRVTYVGRRL